MDLISWLAGTSEIASQGSLRAAMAWRRIQDKPSSIAFRTPAGVVLAAQTVRIESDDRAMLVESDAGAAPRREVIIFGVRDHPEETDTDMAEGYSFVWNGDEYRVRDIILTMGEIQAVAEANG